MRRLSLKMKVGVYAALLTMTALFAGVVVMMVTLYFYQISEIDKDLEGDAERQAEVGELPGILPGRAGTEQAAGISACTKGGVHDEHAGLGVQRGHHLIEEHGDMRGQD